MISSALPDIPRLLCALTATWLVEWLLYAAITRQISSRQGIDFLLLNALTNPLANAAFNLANVSSLMVEIPVIVIEIPLLRLLITPNWTRAIIFSVILNTASALLSICFF
jgi:hypothetical protein